MDKRLAKKLISGHIDPLFVEKVGQRARQSGTATEKAAQELVRLLIGDDGEDLIRDRTKWRHNVEPILRHAINQMGGSNMTDQEMEELRIHMQRSV